MVRTAPPTPDQPDAYAPEGMAVLVFDTYEGVNTNASRPAIEDTQCAWLDGFMPLGKSNARTLPGVGAPIYTSPVQGGMVWYAFGNIGATPYMVGALSDGSLIAVNTATSATTTIAPAGTITSPAIGSLGLTQWGAQALIIVANQPNGYFIWDGTLFYQAGGLGPGVDVTDGGANYTAPAATASGGSGSGITFGTIQVEGGAVVSIPITNPGTGYLATDTITVNITDGTGSGATATVSLMPFGVSGTAAEIYQSRAWVINGPKCFFTAPGSYFNFNTSDGGGEFTSNDSFLRVGFSSLKQTNGFLYLIADSSINYISGVQTAGNPPTTTFSNQNANPEIGTPWGATVDVFSENIILANAFGIHVSYGGRVSKISEMLDGVYNTVPNFAAMTPSGAVAIVFGKRVWMLLLPVIDPISGQQVNKLFMWASKPNVLWASQQDVPLVYIQSQEINSVLTAYGTDGTSVYPLFQKPSTGFTKVAQSKLWGGSKGYLWTKTAGRLWGLANYYSDAEGTLTVSIDNETGVSDVDVSLGTTQLFWINISDAPISWVNDADQPIIWGAAGTGIVVFPPTAVGQQGALLGLTVSTTAADMALISLIVDADPQVYRG